MKAKAMKVTAEIRKLYNDGGNIKAAVSLTIEDVFVVRGVRLVDGKNGLFVSMPSRKSAAGEFFDICFPINNDTRLQILETVKAAYEKAAREQAEAADSAGSGETGNGDGQETA
jgi:stage V sporulation protein G